MTQAPLGAMKPRAILEVAGVEERRLPMAVARALEGDAATWEPSCRAELLHHVQELSRRCASQRLVTLVTQRDYGCQELSERLVRDGYAKAVVDQVVAEAQGSRLLDDRRFAEGFLRSKLASGWGVARIERELRHRGVDPDSIAQWEEWLADAPDESERAWELVERRGVPSRDPYAKTVRFLMGRGYPSSVAHGCARRLMESLEEEGDEP